MFSGLDHLKEEQLHAYLLKFDANVVHFDLLHHALRESNKLQTCQLDRLCNMKSDESRPLSIANSFYTPISLDLLRTAPEPDPRNLLQRDSQQSNL